MSGNTPRPSGTRRPATKGASRSGRSKNGSKKPLTRKEQFRRWLRYGLIAAVLGTVLVGAIFFFAYRATEIPDPNTDFQAQTTKVYYAGGKTPLGTFETQNRESIPLADIPQSMQDAVVAAEDRSFWTNKGIDPKGILRAAFSNAQGGATQGASTITQQYVKILYLTQERTVKRKVKEAFLSLKIQQQQSKHEILEGYLNTIYFGRGAYGVQAASYAYFNRPARRLTPAQSATLAAVLNSPNRLSTDREALLSRYQYVVNGMVDSGAIDSTQGSKIVDTLPQFTKQKTSNQYGGQRGFMLDMVKKELVELGFDDATIEAGGLRVTTTFTRKAMNAARDAVLEERPEGDGLGDKQLHVATASVDVKTGALLGFYGGQDYVQSQLNWAALGGPPGSTFKAFAVAAGIKDGFSLKDTFDGNSPIEIGDTEFSNQGDSGGRSYGRISLLGATENSVNTAFIDMTDAMDSGPEKIVKMANDMGIPKDPDGNSGLRAETGVSLGSATVSPINMANAYSTIANGGLHHDVYTISKVTRASDGEVLFTTDKKSNRVLSEDIAADVSFALQKVISSGTGTNARLDRPAAGKTGTATNDDGDVVSSWFVGYTPQVATAVMYVRGKGNGALDGYLPTFYGGEYPARTFAAVMDGVMEGMEEEDFPKPANVDGDAPSSGHAPAPTKKPKPTKKPTPTTSPTPTPSTPTPSTPEEPILNGVCSEVEGDPDCVASEPVENGFCSDVPGDPDCPPPTECPLLNPNCNDPGGRDSDRSRSLARYGEFARQESSG